MIQEETPVYKKGESQYSLLRYAAMAAKWWEPPRDALDTLTLNAVDMPSMDAVQQLAYMPFDPIVKRTEGTVKEIATGKTYKTTKGAPHVILKLVISNSTNEKANAAITQAVEEDVHSFGLRGIRTLAVAKTNDKEQWEFLGMLTFLDPPRPDTKQTIEDANKYGVAVKMITGDHLLIARETGRVLGMGDYVIAGDGLPLLHPETKKKPDHLSRDYGDMCLAADGFAQVFPEHKYLIVECLRELGYKVGMTGDGVNDAPALKRADVGVAVHGSTDAARAAADIVLTQPGLSTIVNGMLISRRIFVRIKNFLTYRIAATLQLLVFFFIAVLAFKPQSFMPSNWETMSGFPDDHLWPEFFHMPVLMLMLITLLNDGTLIAIGYDTVQARETPEKWNLSVLYLISSVLAAVALVSSLVLLHICLDSWNSGAFGGLSYGQITATIYLKVSISDFLTLFSARTNENFFWTTQPAPILMGAGCLALSLSTIIACAWPPSYPDGVYTEGLGRRSPQAMALYVWLYCIGWWFVQDFAKVYTFHILKKYNYFGYNDTGKLVMPESALRYIKKNKAKDMAKSTGKGHH
jgi:H+-transporting ATPase